MYTNMNQAAQHGSPSRPRLPPALQLQHRLSTNRISKNLNRTAYALKLAASDENPRDYDWGALSEEVDEPLAHGPLCPSDGLCNDITFDSLTEEPEIPGWWDVPEAPDEGTSCADTSHGQELMQQAELQPDRISYPELYPGIVMSTSVEFIPATNDVTTDATAIISVVDFVCEHPKCGLKTFRRKGDLVRHRKLHEGRRQFVCTAQECNYSFTRNDKLQDHIRSGHDDETLFACPRQGCEALMFRDFLPIHGRRSDAMALVRQCPLPKCKFFVRLGYQPDGSDLDTIQRHLLESHDIKGRKRFASLLAERGYHFESADISCPVCPAFSTFETHQDFKEHLLNNHFGCFRLPKAWEKPWYPECRHKAFWYLDANVPGGWRMYDSFPQELHEHRRTILSLWPEFDYGPIWADIKKCPGQ